MSNTFRIIHTSIADIPRLSVFLAKHTPGICDKMEWENALSRFWISNPSITQDSKFGWALEDESEKIRGFIGNIPVQYVSKNIFCPAIWGTSWYVDEEAKDLALKLYINFTRQPEPILSNTQTERVEVIMKKIGFKELPVEWCKGVFAFPLNIYNKHFFSTVITRPSIKKTALALSGMLMKIPQLFVYLFIRLRSFDKSIRIEKVSEFPESTDNWFEEFRTHQDFTLVRNKKTYDWLFCQPGKEDEFIKHQVFYKGLSQGFLVYMMRQLKGFHYIEIVDEALLPLPDQIKKQVLLKSVFALYRESRKTNFILLRSNMNKNDSFWRSLLGIRIRKNEKTYIKSVSVKPDVNKSTITSVDGDYVFFNPTY
jgi:hypothetical protein